MLQLFDKNKNKIAGLIEYKDLCIESVLEDGDKTLSFLYSKNSKYYFDIEEEGYIRTKQDEFVIKEKDIQDNYTTFICKLNVEELEGKTFDRYESIEQTITTALNLAIVGTGWTVAENNIKKKRTVRKTNCSSWDIIKEIKSTYRVDIIFNTLEKKIEIYEHLGQDKGTYFIEDLNLKSLQVQSNSYSYVTRIIPVGKDGLTIKSINNNKNYVENYQYSNKVKTIYWNDDRYTIKESLLEDAKAKLNELSKPYRAYTASIINLSKLNPKYNILDYKLGDDITLISKKNKIKEKQRIIKTIEYPQDHNKDTVELANATLKFEDIQTQFQDAADIVDNITLDDGTLDGEAFEDGGISSDKIDNFKANVIEAAEIHVIKGDIQNLNVAILKAGQAILTKADITQLNSVKAEIQTALIGKANVNELNVAVERVGILEGKTLSVENQLAGNLTSKNFKANSITAGSGIIAEGAIGSAQISSLNVNKLEAGEFITSKHKIVSADGTIEIVGNQILINRNNLNRVILGEYRKQDNTSDYGLLIRAKDGKTIMIDSEGVHNAGITDGAINNNKVADNANIAGNKLDINSVIREVNGATETIKGTRVQIGDRTLDIELSTQNNTITEHGKELSTQKASIQALDKAIKLKVDNQTFTQSTETIKGNINSLNSDLVNKITTSLNNAKLYADSKKQEAINTASTDATNKANNALNSAKEFTTAQITTTNSNLSKATSEINILKEQINTKVGQVDIDKTINNIQIGGRNLALNTGVIREYSDFNGIVNNCQFHIFSYKRDLKPGDKVTVSGVFEYENLNIVTGKKPWIYLQNCGDITSWSGGSLGGYDFTDAITYGTHKDNIYFKTTFIFTESMNKNNSWDYMIRFDYIATGKVKLKNFKVEKGDFATAWTPAPEDTDQLIVDNIKTVTDKINDVSTKLTQTKDSLQASVNSLNNTTQTITTNLTNTTNDLSNKINTAKTDAINSSKSYADTKKNEAISSANLHADSVATTKANIAQSNAIAHADNVATIKSNEALNNAKTYTNAQITTVNTRVSNAENSINILKGQISTKVSQSDIDKTVNNIQIGGRNLIVNSDTLQNLFSPLGGYTGTREVINDVYALCKKDVVFKCTHAGTGFHLPLFGKKPNRIGKTYTWSFWAKCSVNKSGTIGHESNGQVQVNFTTEWKKFTHTWLFGDCTYSSFTFYIGWKVGEILYIRDFKIEEGNKATDWTPAPEDLQQEIKDNITSVTEKINTVESTLTQKTNNINATVSNVQSILNTKADGSTVSSVQNQLASLNINVNGISQKVTDNTNRLKSAELKLEPGRIFAAVNATLASGESIGTILSLTNKALTVYNTNNTSVVVGEGMIRTYDNEGNMSAKLGNNQLSFYDWIDNTGDILGQICSVKKTEVNEKGTMFAGGDYAQYIALGFDENWGDDNNFKSYLELRKKSIVKVFKKISMEGNDIQNVRGINNLLDKETWINRLYIQGAQVNTNASDNNLWLNYWRGSNVTSGKAVNVRIGDGGNRGNHGGLVVGDLWVHGNKHRIVDCGELGFIGMEAYETATPYFGDIGHGTTNEDGECYIIFDKEFIEISNTSIDYIVIVQDEGKTKDTWAKPIKKNVNGFLVKGSPNTPFSYEVKAIQKGFEKNRFKRLDEERSLKTNFGINDILMKQKQDHKNEVEGVTVMDDIEENRRLRYKSLLTNKEENKAMEILNYTKGLKLNG